MKTFTQVTGLMLIAFCLAAFASIHAQTTTLEAPSAEAMRRDVERSASQPRVDVPITEDVQQIIRDLGSVLDGSSLDPANAPASATTGGAARNTVQGFKRKGSKRIRVAETLLRNSRNLEMTTPLDKPRRELVAQMRREAIRLIQESLIQESINQ
ncbi:hypothetical protein CA13_13260 [Planctomycetes bacterium CA13]|uniref:Uncharacterized protein n=1 Tax=Novipirellula herctigrandis TaxID=2527986 RepID=A0A5C5YYX9_9BACT|nr:hypothetical protein CA13_13260 [Planctomycetes bacterium CA13]